MEAAARAVSVAAPEFPEIGARVSVETALAYLAARWPARQVGPDEYSVNGHVMDRRQLQVRLNHLRVSLREPPVKIVVGKNDKLSYLIAV